MPCRMDDMPDYSKEKLINELKKKGDEATKHLCTVMDILDELSPGQVVPDLPKEVQRWWKRHKKVDEKRIKREKIQAEIDKLKEQLKSV